MQTRRGFFGAAFAAIAAVRGALTAVADSTGVQITRTYIRMQYRSDTYPLSLPMVGATPHTQTGPVMVCAGDSRRDLVKFVHAMRDTVWPPKARRKASKKTVAAYMDAYDRMLTCITHCEKHSEYQLLFYTDFLVECTPELPIKLLEYDVVLHDDGSDDVMRRFKSSTKNGRTKTKEVHKVSH